MLVCRAQWANNSISFIFTSLSYGQFGSSKSSINPNHYQGLDYQCSIISLSIIIHNLSVTTYQQTCVLALLSVVAILSSPTSVKCFLGFLAYHKTLNSALLKCLIVSFYALTPTKAQKSYRQGPHLDLAKNPQLNWNTLFLWFHGSQWLRLAHICIYHEIAYIGQRTDDWYLLMRACIQTRPHLVLDNFPTQQVGSGFLRLHQKFLLQPASRWFMVTGLLGSNFKLFLS